MTDRDAPVEIAIGFGPEHRAAAAALYWNAFSRKLDHAIGPRDRGLRLIEKRLDPSRAVVARQDNELVGLAGFNLDGRALATIRARDIIREFGLWSGFRRVAWASILHRTPRSDELLMDGIVVRADRRGRGIGTKLMYRLFDVALAHGKRVVRLDVVDTNPAARQLYEGLGFVAIKTEKVPFLRRFMGFAAATTMERLVN